jgi:predicted TPR repeat methyltransferase
MKKAPQTIKKSYQHAALLFGQNQKNKALELGCGTGLGGMIFRDRCKRLSGIDLAPKMVEISRSKSIYAACLILMRSIFMI